VLGAWSFSRVRTVELKIQDIAFGGKGVARDASKAVFIPFTIEGERVTAKIVREKKQFAEAELVEVLEPSPERVAAPCLSSDGAAAAVTNTSATITSSS